MANGNPDLRLRQLLAAHPLPAGWDTPTLLAERVDVLGTELYLVGLLAAGDGDTEVTGSAVEPAAFPVERAYYELIERATTIDALHQRDRVWNVVDAERRPVGAIEAAALFPESPEPARWRYARSNGVALSTSWSDACRRASDELAERDLLLHAWYGWLDAQPIALPEDLVPKRWLEAYELLGACVSDAAVHAVCIAGFPRAAELPLIFGSAADRHVDGALRHAWRECVQRLGFLWGESVPAEPPPFSASPDYHQEHYLHRERHAALRHWLLHGHASLRAPRAAASAAPVAAGYVCLGDRADGLWVAKCTRPVELPLTFGHGHPYVQLEPASALAIHPIA